MSKILVEAPSELFAPLTCFTDRKTIADPFEHHKIVQKIKDKRQALKSLIYTPRNTFDQFASG